MVGIDAHLAVSDRRREVLIEQIRGDLKRAQVSAREAQEAVEAAQTTMTRLLDAAHS